MQAEDKNESLAHRTNRHRVWLQHAAVLTVYFFQQDALPNQGVISLEERTLLPSFSCDI